MTCPRCHEPFLPTAVESYLHTAQDEPLPPLCCVCRLLQPPPGAEAWSRERSAWGRHLPQVRKPRLNAGPLPAGAAPASTPPPPQPPSHPQRYSADTVLARVAAWIRVQGRVPMTPDFTTDPLLPCMSTVFRYCEGLFKLYALLDVTLPGCAAQYAQQFALACAASARQGQADRRAGAVYQSRKARHQCVDCGAPAARTVSHWRVRCQPCFDQKAPAVRKPRSAAGRPRGARERSIDHATPSE